jgi:hypothetical protein
MPACAPVLNPELGAGIFAPEEVGDGNVEPVVRAALLLVAMETDADEEAVGPIVAAKAKMLDEMLQQLFSPQHHLLSPQFLTGALSFCH